MRTALWLKMTALAFVFTVIPPALAADAPSTWAPAQCLNLPEEIAIKEPKIIPARTGGFHLLYRRGKPAPWAMQYRRFDGQKLSPVITVHSLRFLAGGNIAEAGNGDLWITWENWDKSEQIWAARSQAKYTVNPDLCAQPDGTIYACWESWEAGEPQGWYSVLKAP